MSYTDLFKDAIRDFKVAAEKTGPFQRAIYVATACGGISEVALYTLIGGCFRHMLESKNEKLRLLVDSQVYGSKKRPDFQVHIEKNHHIPEFAVEFKLLSDTGQGRGDYNNKLREIEKDQKKLSEMPFSSPGMERLAVVLFLNSSNSNSLKIAQKLQLLGFEHVVDVKLWEPKGVKCSMSLHIYLAKGKTLIPDEQGG